MALTEAEREDFLHRIAELIDIEVIDKEVRDHIYKTLIMACARKLCEEKQGGQGNEEQL